MRITVAVENTVTFPFKPGIKPGLYGEHGLSLIVEHNGKRWLYDTGRGKALLPNLKTLGVDTDAFDGVILSHGHLDHFGSLKKFLDHRTQRIEAYMHPGVFSRRYTYIGNYYRSVGMPWSRDDLARMGANLHLSEAPVRIDDGVWLTGQVPRDNDFELTLENFLVEDRDGMKHRDDIQDDQALLLETDGGLVVLTGCAHSGLCNILEQAKRVCPGRPIRAVVGGLHLAGVSPERMDKTVAYLQQQDIQRVLVGHCTGFDASCRLARELPGRFAPMNAGMVIDIE